MIKIIAGAKGTGKTARIVEDINNKAMEDNNVVCIERGNRLDQLLKQGLRSHSHLYGQHPQSSKERRP